MASVSSLDQDMRQLRLDRYTPQAANEVRGWIEEVLGEPIGRGDLMDALKDGVALCKYVLYQVASISSVDWNVQTCQSRRPSWGQIQAICNAFCANGEHLSFSTRLRNASSESPIPRSFPHSRSI